MMTEYTCPDFLSLDELLTDDEKLVRQAVRHFVDERVLPGIAEHVRAGTFPLDLVPEMGRRGLLGANIDGPGCTDVGPVGHGLIAQELERGDSGMRSFVSVQSCLVMWPIRHFGSEEQQARWLPLLSSGEAIGCFGLTEADSGSDPGSMKTTARRDGSDYVLNGSKMWITNGSVADVAVVWAKVDDRVCGFLVERGTKGFTSGDVKNKFSLRASITSELAFDDVRIPKENLLPGAEIGLRGPLQCLNQARYSIVWGALGAAMACYDEALRYAGERRQFDRPIASFQLVQQKLVTMITELTKAQLLAYRLGKLKAADKVKHYHISMGKMNNVRTALMCARLGREILGAAGIIDEYQCGRHLCNLESVYTYEGTDDIHTLVVGEAVTGVRALC